MVGRDRAGTDAAAVPTCRNKWDLTPFASCPRRCSGRWPSVRSANPRRHARRPKLPACRVVDLRVERPLTEFYDIGAVVYFLRLVVWIVPGFTVAAYRQQLEQLHRQIERDGVFRTWASRFLIEAVKP